MSTRRQADRRETSVVYRVFISALTFLALVVAGSYCLLPPIDLALPPTRNSVDLFGIVDARLGLPAVVKLAGGRSTEVEAWSPSTLGKGLADVGTWFGRVHTQRACAVLFGLTPGLQPLASLLA